MPRRRFRHSPRFDTPAERSHQEYLHNQSAQITTRTELLRLIRGGEDTYLELKLKLSNPERITQGIVALANTDGGTIIFGVNDQLRIEGISNPEDVQQEINRICRDEIVPPILPLIDCIAFDSGKGSSHSMSKQNVVPIALVTGASICDSAPRNVRCRGNSYRCGSTR